jgi:hypothetical protein
MSKTENSIVRFSFLSMAGITVPVLRMSGQTVMTAYRVVRKKIMEGAL